MTIYGFLSTYPPTRCGLATFTASLASAIPAHGDPDSRVVRVDDLVPTGPPTAGPRSVLVGDLHPGDARGRGEAAATLSGCDVVVVQHEYGIYGGRDGDEILDLLARVTAFRIVVLHTVREAPTAHQRWVIERLAALASAVVVMTTTARDLLARRYSVPMSKVNVIPHGVADWHPVSAVLPRERPIVLTWGLLGPGKGIEWGIRALAQLQDLPSRPLYRIAGQTHPKVVSDSGESYRTSLQALARELWVVDDVEFDGRYRDAAELAELVAQADAVLLPYDSREQSTSGVLVEAVAAGKPVVATRFPHAVELLSGGGGILVDHESPGDIAAALRRILNRSSSAPRVLSAVPAPIRANRWDAVAAQYRQLAASLAASDAA